MPKIRHIALITSCIVPNTKSGPITNFSKKQRLNQLAKNINFVSDTKILDHIYVIDPFLINEKKKIEFKTKLHENGLRENSKINLIIFKPSKEIIKEIISRGKGYSELKMIIHCNKIIKRKHKNCIIHKISGRYIILNLKKIIIKSELMLKKKYFFFLPYSKLLSKCLTIIFSYKSEIEEKIFDSCLFNIDDSSNKYLEHSMFRNIVKRKIVLRNRNIPKLEFNMIGGSKQGRYGRFKQIINKFIYGYY